MLLVLVRLELFRLGLFGYFQIVTKELALSSIWLTVTQAVVGLLLMFIAAHMFAIVIALRRKSCQHVGPVLDAGNESQEV